VKVLILTVPYITNNLHLDYAIETLDSLKSKKHELEFWAIVNNWTAEASERLDSYFRNIVVNDTNCLSKAWNMGVALAVGKFDYIIIPNLDIIASQNTIDELIKFAEAHPEADLWTASETLNKDNVELEAHEGHAESPHFSFFMIKGDVSLFSKLENKEQNSSEPYPGLFDMNLIPAYHEDADYHHRMKRAGLLALRAASSTFYHYGSRTIKASDDPFRAETLLGSGRTRGYYLEKWGGLPGQEIFTNPFNK